MYLMKRVVLNFQGKSKVHTRINAAMYLLSVYFKRLDLRILMKWQENKEVKKHTEKALRF